MRLSHLAGLLLFVLASTPEQAPAQHWEAEVNGTLGRYRVNPGPGLQSGDPLPEGDSVALVVSCTGGADCRGVYVLDSIGGRELRGNWRLYAPAEPERAVFVASTRYLRQDADIEKRLVFELVGLPVGSVALTGRATGRIAGDAGRVRADGAAGTILAGNPIHPCRNRNYPTGDDHAVIVASGPGNVLYSTHREIDELDSVTVYVQSSRNVLSNLRIRRTSAMRGTTGFSIAGSGTQIPEFSGLVDYDAEEGCLETHAVVKDFAPGAGTIGIEYLQESGGQYRATPVSTLEIPVVPMHHAGLSLGVINTGLQDPSYQLVGTDSTVTRTAGGRRTLYAVMLTPFVLGRRNVERSADEFWQHLSPTFGVVLNQIQNNALVGLTVDLPMGTYVTWGYHFGKVTALSPGGPREGEKLKGTGRTLATHQPWRHQNFVSFTVDLRAAAALLTAATRR